MFNSKLKKQIEELENRIWKLENRIWKLENKPRYKVGDKINKEWIVTEVLFKEGVDNNYQYSHHLYSWEKDYYNHRYDYRLTNIKTGETKTI